MARKTLSLFAFTVSLFLLTPVKLLADLKFGTFNIRNYDYDAREKIRTNNAELLKVIQSANPDLMAIEEIVEKERFQTFVKTFLPDYSVSISDCGGRGNQKLGFLYKNSLFKVIQTKEDQRVNDNAGCMNGVRPAFWAVFEHLKTSEKFVALALHLKAGGAEENHEQRFKQLGAVTQIIKEIKELGFKNIIAMGDLNTTDFKDKGQNYQRFMSFLEVNGLSDFSRDLRCTAYWWGGTQDGIEEGSVLDHVMMSNEFLSSFKSSSVKLHSHCAKVSCENVSVDSLGVTYAQVSDHCPVVAEAVK